MYCYIRYYFCFLIFLFYETQNYFKKLSFRANMKIKRIHIISTQPQPFQHRSAPSRFASQSFLLQLKRFLKCINHTIPSRSDMKVSIVSLQFKVYNGLHLILSELGRIVYDVLLPLQPHVLHFL